MRQRGRMIGLTGGIATGKSTAARHFARLGATVIDADQVARRVVEPGEPALEEIRQAFGDEALDSHGELHRQFLAGRVFRDPAARERLNAIVHPRVADEVDREVEAVFRREPDALVVYDVPLLFEAGLADRFDLVVVVYAPASEQERRLVKRDGLSPEAARARIASQMDIEEKARRADVVLDNQAGEERLAAQVRDLVARLQDRNSRSKAPRPVGGSRGKRDRG